MKNTKLISLFAILFLAFFNINPNSLWSADDENMVWRFKGTSYYGGTLFSNDKIIAFYSGSFIDFLNTETGEKFHTIQNANRLYFINNDDEFFQMSNDRKFFVKYKTNGFIPIDSIVHDNNVFSSQYLISINSVNLYEILLDRIRVWDIEQKKVIREMLFPKYDEPDLYSHNIVAGLDCNNEKIIGKHIKDYRPQGPPQFWYEIEYIAFYDALTLDSLNAIKITGGRFSLSNTCKYFVRMQGKIELYDFNTLKLLKTFDGLDNINIRTLNFTNDDKYLITTESNNYIIQIWDLKENKLIKTYDKTVPGDILSITNDNKFAFCSVGNIFFKLRLNLDPNSVEDIVAGDTNPYPNPTNSSLEIKYNVRKPNVFQYEVTNLAGQFLIRNNLGFRNVGENIETIDVENLPIGQYNLKIYSENEVVNFKFIRGE